MKTAKMWMSEWEMRGMEKNNVLVGADGMPVLLQAL